MRGGGGRKSKWCQANHSLALAVSSSRLGVVPWCVCDDALWDARILQQPQEFLNALHWCCAFCCKFAKQSLLAQRQRLHLPVWEIWSELCASATMQGATSASPKNQRRAKTSKNKQRQGKTSKDKQRQAKTRKDKDKQRQGETSKDKQRQRQAKTGKEKAKTRTSKDACALVRAETRTTAVQLEGHPPFKTGGFCRPDIDASYCSLEMLNPSSLPMTCHASKCRWSAQTNATTQTQPNASQQRF